MAKNGGDNNETRPGEQAHKSPMRDHLGHVADPVRDMLKKGPSQTSAIISVFSFDAYRVPSHSGIRLSENFFRTDSNLVTK
jgi:hypothetical protein